MSELFGGLAEVDITPVRARLAGQFHRRESTGIHDSLKAKAFILEHGFTKLAFVFCDLVDVPIEVSQLVRGQLQSDYAVGSENSFVSATHTHTGPEFHGVRRDYYHAQAQTENGRDIFENPEYPYSEELAESIMLAVDIAHLRLEPVDLAVGTAKQRGISFNRHFQARGLGTTNFNDHGNRADWPIDPEIGIMIVRAKDSGIALGGLTVFACHPDTMGGSQFSADYPHYIERALRAKMGGSYVSAFAQGASGDINHVAQGLSKTPKGDAIAAYVGGTLGNTILTNLNNLQAIDQPALAAARKIIALPLQSYEVERLEEAQASFSILSEEQGDLAKKIWAVKTVDLARQHHLYGDQLPAEIQAFRFDEETALVTLPGEVFASLGLDIKANSPFPKTMLATISNDRPSYIPSDLAFEEGDYGERVSRVERGAGEIVTNTAIELLNELNSINT